VLVDGVVALVRLIASPDSTLVEVAFSSLRRNNFRAPMSRPS